MAKKVEEQIEVFTGKDWQTALTPLIEKYRGKQHPLDYKNTYQLLVMVVLSAQDSDKNINSLAPALFDVFPNMDALSNATSDTLLPLVRKIRKHADKSKWLIAMAQTIKTDSNIPLTMAGLTALPGLGRKSANVIMREAHQPAEGVIVDLHVVRVAPRLGIAIGEDPKKIEKQIMEVIQPADWGEVGMALSFHGRETCRPTNPKHDECIVKNSCAYFKSLGG